jgi:hypothetical protein
MSDKEVRDFMASSDMEEAIVAKAQEVFLDAWQLAIDTQDEELFNNVWKQATTLVLDDILTSLVQKGLVEPAGMNETGEMTYQLTPTGLKVRDVIE